MQSPFAMEGDIIMGGAPGGEGHVAVSEICPPHPHSRSF